MCYFINTAIKKDYITPKLDNNVTLVNAVPATHRAADAPTKNGFGPTPFNADALVLIPTAAIAVPSK